MAGGVGQQPAQCLRARQDDGELRDDITPEWPARLVIAAFDGLRLQWLYDKGVDMAEGLRQLVAMLAAPGAESVGDVTGTG